MNFQLDLLLDVFRGWLALLSVLATLCWVFDPRESDEDGVEAPVRTSGGSRRHLYGPPRDGDGTASANAFANRDLVDSG